MTNLESALQRKRDNNLNLIRLIAAYAVLISHSYAIYTGDPATEPLRSSTGFSLGGIAVWVFFGISGLLIYQSWENSSASKFIASRCARILPALFVSAVATLLVGAFVTTLAASDYWKHSETITYLPRFVTLVFMRDSLPGVFEQNPFPLSVNGSAWTLFYEVSCYAMVFIVGLIGTRVRGAMIGAIAIVFGLWLAVEVFHLFTPSKRLADFIKLGFPFALGMLIYECRYFTPLSLLAAAFLWMLTWLSAETPVYSTVFVVSVVYTTFYAGYVVKGFRWYNSKRIGDVSYGVYIYTFTIQQIVVHLMPDISIASFIALVTAIVLPISYASWHFIEEPVMQRSKHLGARLDRSAARA